MVLSPRRTVWLPVQLRALDQPDGDVCGILNTWSRSFINIPSNKVVFNNNHEIQLIIIIMPEKKHSEESLLLNFVYIVIAIKSK